MKKRLLALSMAMIMVAGTLTACTSEQAPADGGETATEAPAEGGEEATEATEATEEAEPETNEAVEVAEGVAKPDVTGWDESKKIYYYGWDDDFGKAMSYVLDANPELKDYVEYVNVGVGGTSSEWKDAVNNALDGQGDKYPSIWAADNAIAKQWFEDKDKTLSMSELGITADMYANAYNYTKEFATVDGDLRALTWQATPGVVLYRSDIAEDVWGTSDPAEIQEKLKDWDSFLTAAEDLKAAGYYITSGTNEVRYAYYDAATSPWVVDNGDDTYTLQLDSSVSDFLNMSKTLYDNDYTKRNNQWDGQWSANMNTGDVFCYFGTTWFIGTPGNGCLGGNTDYTDWKAITGPSPYHWGGSYVMVGKDCPNPELAAYLVYELCCDEEVMYAIGDPDGKGDFVNNKAANEKLIADGKGASEMLGGQNVYQSFADAALTISLSNSTFADDDVQTAIDEAATDYNNGNVASVEDALEEIKEKVTTKLPYVKAE